MENLVSIKWLKDNYYDSDLVLLDCSLNVDVTSHKSIPGSQYFDIKKAFSDRTSAFPNAIPTADQFENECQKLGIDRTSKIVVFDHKGIYSSPRAWWLFKTMGHESVAVLDGGLPAWIKAGHETEILNSSDRNGNFEAKLSAPNVKSFEDVLDNIKTKSFLLVDARSQGRFEGVAPEPRKTLKSGHIPNSKNMPFTSLLTDGKLRPKNELQQIFKALDDDREFVFSCGSGITACILALASEVSGHPCRSIFDGSWTEWAERNGLKTE